MTDADLAGAKLAPFDITLAPPFLTARSRRSALWDGR